MDNLSQYYRGWTELDLDHLLQNYDRMKTAAGDASLMPVVKADAYGHGAVQIAKTLQQERGVQRFAVVTPEEAQLLRQGGVDGDILLMGLAPPACIPFLQEANISVCVPNWSIATQYAKAAHAEKALRIHIKLDTGMSRLGFCEEEAEAEILKIAQLKPLFIEGMFTQLSSSDLPKEDEFTKEQHRCFQRIAKKLMDKGISIPFLHCANSAATMGVFGVQEDCVRNGLSLYGYQSREEELPFVLSPILSWRSSLVQCKSVKQGTSVGYDRAFRAPRDMRIATIPVGYADGYLRGFSKNGVSVLIRGKKAPLIGNICMDMCMVDISHIEDATEGDVVTLLGRDGSACLSANDLAEALGTISYEILCTVGKRVPRLYRQHGTFLNPPYWSGYFSPNTPNAMTHTLPHKK